MDNIYNERLDFFEKIAQKNNCYLVVKDNSIYVKSLDASELYSFVTVDRLVSLKDSTLRKYFDNAVRNVR